MQLYPHQQKALDETADRQRVAYYLDMGLGKTYVGSEKMMQLAAPVNLIVCQKSKIDDWFNHMVENYAMNHCWLVYNLTDKKDFEWFFKEVENRKSDSPVICGIINYELLFRRPQLSVLRGFTMMLDESSMIQNEASKRAKFVLKMHPENVILLSGTPTAGKYERLWSQLHLLGWPISKNLYYSQYIVQEWIEDSNSGFKIPHVVGYKNVDRLKAKLAQHGAIFMKSDEVFNLPQQVFNTVKVPSPREYRRFMRNDVVTVKNLLTGEQNELVGDMILTKRLYARMLCSQYNRFKLDAFTDLMNSTSDRLIVFYNFNDELELLKDAAEKAERPISIVNGSVKDLSAYEECSDSITFLQYQAGAMGLNLQKANHMIYFSLTDKSELFEQSKKRIHRIGQENPCFYYLMICPNTVEEDVMKALETRRDYTDELFKKYAAQK
jgi:SNF2 family DNA or RNA helicase